ncbi:uncharacterized protein EMH_0035750 [Eimeria mitis]|uniref:Uncharacterized protein n=1 Tax=Eimeria mitis TaxID=44415 RepID=U6JWJ8_9EIME|nr:uncharacterized protein EMH_0035750 [Eimeria mitis]CDJ27883.1 hypothetical protein EMH_0035750 [Eimeria mitis]
MGILRRIAGELPPQTSDPPEVTGQGTDPAPENTDNSDIVVKAGGASLSKRGRGKRLLVTKAVIAAVAMIVVWGARYIMSGRSISYLKASQMGLGEVPQPSQGDAPRLLLDDVSMRKYMNDLHEAADEMEKVFSSAMSVRQDFQLHFTPSLEDGQNLLGDPLAVIKNHVAKMQKCKVPSASSPQARRDFAQHLQLLRSICRAATLRVKQLMWFYSENQQFGETLPFSGDGEPSSSDPVEDFDEGEEVGWSASGFLEDYGLFGGDGVRGVNVPVARRLQLLLDIGKRYNDANLNVRYYFMEFLQPFEGDGAFDPAHAPAEHQIPYTGKPFRTGALAQAAAHIFRGSDATTKYAYIQKLNQIADNWTNKAVVAAANEQEKQNADNAQNRLETKRELMRRLLRQGIQKDDLVMIALFLL